MSLAHSCQRSVLVSIFFILFSTSIASPAAPASESKPHWILVSSSHFSVLTDADEKKANAVLLRMEQMRIVFGQLLSRTQLTMSEPLDIIAFNTREEYVQFSPVRDGQPITTSGFLLPGKDRNFIGLDLSDDESWRAISLPLARIYLNYNYPPTEAWFDDGLAEYFSSLRLNAQQAEIGGDPASLLPVLASQPWLPVAQLFAKRSDPDPGTTGAKSATKFPLFRAESWVVMHYVLNQNKLPETGTYFGLTENQKLPIEQSIQQAYGVTAPQFDQALQNYSHALAATRQNTSNSPGAQSSVSLLHHFPPPLTPLDVGTSILRLQEFEAQARLDELAVRIPERREQAVKDLQTLIALPKEETAIAHRALAWVHMQKREYDDAFDELASAAELDPADPWVHYYLALAKYQQATETGNPIQGLANMMQDLRRVTDWNRDFAEAYNMLAMAQLQGGGLHAAADSMRPAIQLNPRSETYLLNLARIYLEGKKWDDATALLDRLKSSHDSQIARAAQQHLHDLPMLKKYGIPPQENPQAAAAPTAVLSNNTEDAYASAEPPESTPAEAGPDLRKTQFLRGTILGVDCSQPPAAIVRLSSGGKTLRLRTEDYRSLLLIGAGAFSCDWKNVAVQVNYKAGGKANGDLVSLEIR
jgi:tetratricopeptide (TPR) repeat protein